MKRNNSRLGQRFALLVFVILAGVVLAGCAGNKNLRDNENANLPAAGSGSGSNQGNPMQQGRNISVRGLQGISPGDRSMFEDPNNPLSTRIIYFDFDSSAIPSRFADAIQAHARYLAKHPNVNLRLEGNTDERGTREYNIALGERRAQSVKQALVLDGANAGQISTISYGEERPAVPGHTKAAYAKDRRVVFIYPK